MGVDASDAIADKGYFKGEDIQTWEDIGVSASGCAKGARRGPPISTFPPENRWLADQFGFGRPCSP